MRMSKLDAISTLETAGLIVSDHEFTIYADADCSHCGSRYKVGELEIVDGTVEEEEVDFVVEQYEDRRTQ